MFSNFLSKKNLGLAVLGEKRFRMLFLARVISSLGDRISPIALTFAVFQLTGSEGQLGIVMATRTGAMIAFLLLGGVWADRLPRRQGLIATDLLRFISQGVTAFLLISGYATVLSLIILQAIAGAGQGFFRSASTGLVPYTVPSHRLLEANAVLGIAENGVTIFGAGLAGILVVMYGTGWAIAVDAVTFGFSALFLSCMCVGEKVRTSGSSVISDLISGWKEFSSRTWLVSLVLQFSLFHLLIWAPMLVLGPFIAERELGGASTWVTVLTIQAIGSIVGGGIGMRLNPKRPMLVVSLLFLPQTLPLFVLSFMPQSMLLSASMFLAGMAVGYLGALWKTILQRCIPDEVLSRVSSYDWFASMVFLPLGYTLVGPLDHWLGSSAVLCLGSCLQIATVVLMSPLIWRQKEEHGKEKKTSYETDVEIKQMPTLYRYTNEQDGVE